MQRGCDSLPTVEEEEKLAMSISIQISHDWGRVGSGCPLRRVTRHPLAEPDGRVSRYPALPLRFAEDSLDRGAYQHGAADDMAYRGSVFSCVGLPSVAAIAPSRELHP
jgi:hypothetical protein